MNLRKVTLTGIDASIDPWDLVILVEKYPFVEWGVLFSKTRQGKEKRYPDKRWLSKLGEISRFHKTQRGHFLPLSAHLCGHFARELITTHTTSEGWITDWQDEYWHILRFNRFQLNLPTSLLSSLDLENVHNFLPEGQIIIQSHEGFRYLKLSSRVWSWNDGKQRDVSKQRFSVLYDISGGTGMLPGFWDESDSNIFCGYAGGLNPDNVLYQLSKIREKSERTDIWIDMESGVRDFEDNFSLQKAELVLQLVQSLVVR